MSLRVNNRSYGWHQMSFKTPFGDLEADSIDYGDELEKELVYGTGCAPHGYGTGNYKASCKMSFLLDYWEPFEERCKAAGQSLYELEIPKLVVSYANPGSRPRTDEITRLTISKVDHKGAQGDKSLKVEVEFLVAGTIVRNGLKPIQ